MKRFVYFILFLIFLLTLKAFYLDPYISENFKDSNESTEVNQSNENNITPAETTQVEPEAQATGEKVESKNVPKAKTEKEKMPLDKLGDSIAGTLEDKIGKQ